jgi:TPR repeat protein
MVMLIKSGSMTTNLKTTEDWNRLLALAESGDPVAQSEVASYYDSGLVVKDSQIIEENESLAFKWYYKAYENGSVDVVTRIADFLSDGIHCQQNIALAIELYQKRIENGDGLAANNLAIVYRDQKEYQKAFELHKIAQDLSKTSSLKLALCYHFGIGTEKDVKKSFEIFNNIANDSSEFINCQYEIDEANYFLGSIYLDGAIVEKSITKARTFLKLANTDDDHRSAQELLMLIGKE